MEKLKALVKTERFRISFNILVGCLVGAAAYPLFLVPNNIAPGGLTGVATVLYYLFDCPVGITSMILNLPLFVLGYKTMGRLFAIRSLIATVLFSILIDLLKLPPLTNDPLLACVYGGIVLGLGLGLIIKGGATTGGTDMIARMVHNKVPFISVGLFLFMIDFCVTILAGFTMSVNAALYALICIFVISKVLDLVLSGIGTASKACFIISCASDAILARIMHEMDRGATVLDATGAYSKEKKPVILCVVSARDVAKLKRIVKDEDERAFMIISDTHETLGEGFSNLSA